MNKLAIAGVLVFAVSCAFAMRMLPAKYGFYLNEHDPYFDYRATQYIVDNGWEAYLQWHDEMSWFPQGRDIAPTSQGGLHLTAATLYKPFSGHVSLMDFTIIFPVVIGSLTVFAVFALVRVIAGTRAGLAAAMIFAFLPSIIVRGNLGWFKSEPLGLFFGILSMHLFVSAIKSRYIEDVVVKSTIGGVLLGLGVASWGGGQFFVLPVALFAIALPFFKRDVRRACVVMGLFALCATVTAGSFPRPGEGFVLGFGGLALFGATAFLVAATLVMRRAGPGHRTRNLLILLAVFAVGSGSFLAVDAHHTPSSRYLQAVNPFISTSSVLSESVAEHYTPSMGDFFIHFSVLLLFAGLGFWLSLRKRADPVFLFAVVLALTSLYVTASYGRLMVFAAVGVTVLSSIAISHIMRSLASHNTATVKKVYTAIIVAVLTVPLFYPPNSNWMALVDLPPDIIDSSLPSQEVSSSWLEATGWIRENTEEDAVIAAWWHHGYWITALGERATLSDNATINPGPITFTARVFLYSDEVSRLALESMQVDYVLIHVVAQKQEDGLYRLGPGGYESHMPWMAKMIEREEIFVEKDGRSPRHDFWDTTLGKMIPFKPVDGGGYGVEWNYLQENNGPFSLVHTSGFGAGDVDAVLIYKVNHEYQTDDSESLYNKFVL